MLADTCTSRTFSNVCGMSNASSRNQIATRRKIQSPACQNATVRKYSAGRRTTEKACLTRSQKSTTCPWIQIPATMAAMTSAATARSNASGWSRSHEKSKLGSLGSSPRPGRASCVRAAHASTVEAAAMSKIERTRPLETTVVYVLSRIARCARTTRTASPALRGTSALTPTPARYAPMMDRRRTV